jgi:hypothetical protein
MSAPEFDPLDLAMLAATIGAGTAGHWNAPRWSQDDCEQVQAMAEMLHRLWLEIPENEWPGVFVYDVTEPVGRRVARKLTEAGAERATHHLEGLQEFAEREARALIAGEIAEFARMAGDV